MIDFATTTLAIALLIWAWLATATDVASRRVHGLVIGDGGVAGTRIVRARRWLNCRAGLLNHAGLLSGHGLWIDGRSAVHTRGMLFAIDLAFIDSNGQVLDV